MASLSLTRGTDLDQGSGLSYQIEDYRTPEFAVASAADDDGPYVRGTPLDRVRHGHLLRRRRAARRRPSTGRCPLRRRPTRRPAGTASTSVGGRRGGCTARRSPSPTAAAPVAPGRGRRRATALRRRHRRQRRRSPADRRRLARRATSTATRCRSRVQPTVTDVNRQAWSSTTSVLVHPAQRYVGLRTAGTFVDAGVPLGGRGDRHRHRRARARRVSRSPSRPAAWSRGVVDGEWTDRARRPADVLGHLRRGRGHLPGPALDRRPVPARRHGRRRAGPSEPHRAHPLGRWRDAGAAPRTIDAQTLTVVPDGRRTTRPAAPPGCWCRHRSPAVKGC